MRVLVLGLMPLIFPDEVLAQDFPSRPIRLIVAFPPGGAVDGLARALSAPLTRALGQSMIIENRPGANTVIAAEVVARAPADGYTLLMMATSFTVNPHVQSKLPYDTLNDFAGVGLSGGAMSPEMAELSGR